MNNKYWWASKTIWVQGLGLIGMVLISVGLVGDDDWAKYLGIATTVLGVVIRFITKGEVMW
jgi:hypothetical protein